MSERGLERKTALELFGDLAYCKGERYGSRQYIKVAPDAEFVRECVREKGLHMIGDRSLEDTPSLCSIFEDGHTLGEGLTLWISTGGVWVSEEEMGRYDALIGIEEKR